MNNSIYMQVLLSAETSDSHLIIQRIKKVFRLKGKLKSIIGIIIFAAFFITSNLFPQSMKELDDKAYDAYDKKNYKEAIEILNERIREFPNATDKGWVFNLRGLCYRCLKNNKEALADFSESIYFEASDYNYYNRGFFYNEMGEYAKAVSDFTSAILINKDHIKSYEGRAFAYCNLKNYDKSFEDYTTLMKAEPNNDNAYYGRGVNYFEMGKYTEAVSELNKSLELNPNFADGYEMRGKTYYFLKDYTKALADFEKAYSLNKNLDPSLPDLISECRNKLKSNETNTKPKDQNKTEKQEEIVVKPETAESLIKKIEDDFTHIQYKSALEKCNNFFIKYPDYSGIHKVYFLRGKAYYSLQDYKKAIDDFTSAINLSEDAEYYFYRSYSYYYKRDMGSALIDATKSISINPDEYYYRLRGMINFKIKLYDDAIYDFSKSYDLRKQDLTEVIDLGQIYNMDTRGDAYNALGKYEEAIKDWEFAKTMDKGNGAYYDKKINEAKIKMK